MSASPARTVPLRAPAQPAPKRVRVLWLVPQRRSQASKTPFVVVVVTLLVGGLLGLLLLNTLVAQDSFRLHALAKEARELQQREQLLAAQLQDQQAPAELATRARALGMLPGGPPGFLRLSDGRVLGKPTRGKAPAVAPKPAARPVAKTPAASTTWTAPRQTPPPTSSDGAQR